MADNEAKKQAESLLREEHTEAGEDFDNGDVAAGKKEDRDIFEQLKHFTETIAGHVKDIHDHLLKKDISENEEKIKGSENPEIKKEEQEEPKGSE